MLHPQDGIKRMWDLKRNTRHKTDVRSEKKHKLKCSTIEVSHRTVAWKHSWPPMMKMQIHLWPLSFPVRRTAEFHNQETYLGKVASKCWLHVPSIIDCKKLLRNQRWFQFMHKNTFEGWEVSGGQDVKQNLWLRYMWSSPFLITILLNENSNNDNDDNNNNNNNNNT